MICEEIEAIFDVRVAYFFKIRDVLIHEALDLGFVCVVPLHHFVKDYFIYRKELTISNCHDCGTSFLVGNESFITKEASW